MFNKNTIEKRFNIAIGDNDTMIHSIEMWRDMYSGESYWLNDITKDLGLASSIAGELARLVTLEFESEILNNDCINANYQKFISNLKVYCEYACAKGGIVFKPYFEDGCISINIIQADKFHPISFNSNGDIDSAVFIETKTIGDKIYSRVEYHSFEGKNYIIRNAAYEKSSLNSDLDSLGKEVPLETVEEWSLLKEEIKLKNINKPLFSYFKIPLANNIDCDSPLGVSVYAKAVNLIKEADKQYSRILWEYSSKETAIHASSELFKPEDKGRINKIGLSERDNRLYKMLDIDPRSKVVDSIYAFSPEIRDDSLFNGLNQLLRRIEFNCGLAYGTLSDINETDKTATEIKASKQRSYSTVKDIQKSLETSLKDLVYSIWVLAKIYKLPCQNIDIENDIICNWDDSIVVDRDTELISMFNDVSANLLRPEIYIAKKYNVSEKEALKMMPEVKEIPKSPMDRFEE